MVHNQLPLQIKLYTFLCYNLYHLLISRKSQKELHNIYEASLFTIVKIFCILVCSYNLNGQRIHLYLSSQCIFLKGFLLEFFMLNILWKNIYFLLCHLHLKQNIIIFQSLLNFSSLFFKEMLTTTLLPVLSSSFQASKALFFYFQIC